MKQQPIISMRNGHRGELCQMKGRFNNYWFIKVTVPTEKTVYCTSLAHTKREAWEMVVEWERERGREV